MSRVPPQNLDAERSVLGAMMLNRAVIDDVVDILDGRDFYDPRHERIYDAIQARHNRGEPVDALLVADELGKDLVKVGGAPYLHDLLAAVPSAANAAYYADQVREAATRRALIESGMRIEQIGWDAEGDGDELFDRAEEVLSAARRIGHTDTSTRLDEAVLRVLERLESGAAAEGITTGQPDIDRILEPLKPGQLTIVGARPGCGKSVFLLDLARHAVFKLGVPTLILSLEMRADELATRAIAAEAAVDMHSLQQGQLADRDWRRVNDAVGRIMNAPLWIEDQPAQDLASVRAKVRAHVRRHGAGLVLIDYLQLIIAPTAPTRREAVDAVSRGLKVLVGLAGVPLVVAAQLNRAVEARHDRTPTLADLRESGGIEADADNVLLLHRPGDTEQEALESGEVEVTIAKQRAGRLGRARLGFQSHYARMVPLARPEQIPPTRTLHSVSR